MIGHCIENNVVKVLGITEKLQNCKLYTLQSSLNIPYDEQIEEDYLRGKNFIQNVIWKIWTEWMIRGFFKKFPHFYIFAGNGEGGRSSNWSCLRVSCD